MFYVNCKNINSYREQMSLEILKTFFLKTNTKTFLSRPIYQDEDFIFVLEVPRDQDLGGEDYITGMH